MLRQPELTGRLLIVTLSDRGRHLVLDASGEAAGVLAGQTVAEALSQCSGAVTLPADPIYLSEINDTCWLGSAMQFLK